MRKMHFFMVCITIFALCMGVVSCNLQPSDIKQATPSGTIPVQKTPAQSDNGQQGKNSNIIIDTLDILILESFPVQVKANFSGSFSNGCTQIKEVTTNRNDHVFEISVVTEQTGEICTEVLTPFDYTVDLDVIGLKAGKYLVKLLDKTAEFELPVDNSISDDSNDDGIKPGDFPTSMNDGGIVYIDSITVTVFNNRKIQVYIQGNLPDGCTKIKNITSEFIQEKTILIHINTKRPSQAMCTMALVPFEEIYEIDGKDLPSGTYRLMFDDQIIPFSIND